MLIKYLEIYTKQIKLNNWNWERLVEKKLHALQGAVYSSLPLEFALNKTQKCELKKSWSILSYKMVNFNMLKANNVMKRYKTS